MVPKELPAMPRSVTAIELPGESGDGRHSVHWDDFHALHGTLGAPLETELIERLLCTTVEQAGAERAVLLLMRGDSLRIAAEANTTGDVLAAVHVQDALIEPTLLADQLCGTSHVHGRGSSSTDARAQVPSVKMSTLRAVMRVRFSAFLS